LREAVGARLKKRESLKIYLAERFRSEILTFIAPALGTLLAHVLAEDYLSRSALSIALSLALWVLILAMMWRREYRERVDVPILVSSRLEDLEILEKAVERAGGKPWSPELLRRLGLPTAGRSILCVEVGGVGREELSHAFSRMVEKISLARTLFGPVSVRFHVYVTEDCPTSAAFLVGMALGSENHRDYEIYHRWGEVVRVERSGGREVSLAWLELRGDWLEEVDPREFAGEAVGRVDVLVDATPSSLNVSAMRGVEGRWLVARVGRPSTLGPEEMGYVVSEISRRVAEVIADLDGRGIDVALALKAPHPLSVELGFKLRYHRPSCLLQYDRRSASYRIIPTEELLQAT